ncbi:pyruvate dehydrogenase (acetyl-transferring) kinase, mitochondrial [Eurytemora carolleeae]|uniref:pyruvate dehydrogenase (acetyl-transferring) kinase, mitochondrial n=1 Tax=Eurytemora carolleeae TaxID=1294199 RepID=UPI000C77654D|nr:pyruvate dehydrogenase (acetyl-transferring) kinase, mitochondrial [Eurytemora carolleeae]|eukprot:XP_023331729.1 pyruvate dehydrogenase (acetyl-transferring) kinase, mitochondrial-like [Eurytemora affinis]
MAQAVLRMHKYERLQDGVTEAIQYFLDRLYTNRISIHMLISHYQSLHGITKSEGGLVGTIDPHCDLLQVAEEAYSAASLLCDNEYFDHPKLVSTAVDTTDENINTRGRITAVYVPAHLHHILFEIFKNSMRASCEWAEQKELSEIPHIRLKIYKTANDITLKISDRGGGIDRARRAKIFNYMYSTAPKVLSDGSGGSYGVGEGLSSEALPMHGLGYGLPLSRLYARYFKGDIKVGSVDGLGIDVYVYLHRISQLAQENLPVYNHVSSTKLTSTSTQVPDWTDKDIKY